MRRLLAVSGLGALLAVGLAAGLVTSGVADATIAKGTNGGGDGYVPVTICHGTPTGAGGSGPANKYEMITPDNQGVFNGHLGHPNDIIPAPAGGCPTPEPPDDWCPNLPGDQTEVPDGYVQNENGRCVPIPPPTDLCLNIEGVQDQVPEGFTRNENGRCVPTSPPPTDVCPNIDGNQGSVPDGMVIEEGKCVTPPPRLCPDGKPPTPGEGAYDPNDDCKRPPAPVTETTPTTTTDTTPTTTTDTTPTTTTDTTPTTPAAPFTPPTRTKPAVQKPAANKPAVKKTAPAPKTAVAGAFAQEPPKLAYTP